MKKVTYKTSVLRGLIREELERIKNEQWDDFLGNDDETDEAISYGRMERVLKERGWAITKTVTSKVDGKRGTLYAIRSIDSDSDTYEEVFRVVKRESNNPKNIVKGKLTGDDKGVIIALEN